MSTELIVVILAAAVGAEIYKRVAVQAAVQKYASKLSTKQQAWVELVLPKVEVMVKALMAEYDASMKVVSASTTQSVLQEIYMERVKKLKAAFLAQDLDEIDRLEKTPISGVKEEIVEHEVID